MFKRFFDYFREQRDRERETFLSVIKEVTAGQEKQTELIIEQTKLLGEIASMFHYTGDPIGWTVREADEARMEKERLEAENAGLHNSATLLSDEPDDILVG